MCAAPRQPSPQPGSTGGRWPALLLLLLAVFAVAGIGGLAASGAGSFYATLERPAWAPPAWVFGPVWTVLYVTVAVAAWLVLRRSGGATVRTAMLWWGVQLALNCAWTPLFFAARQYGLAFADICLLLASVVVTAVLFGRIHRPAAWLLLPYAAWVAFAACLNLALWQLNT
ncbi:TspO/MBR family protein [Streptomyces sp. NPDC058655]|uniref:TspO/MBR family protein n=1 Tax=Streptomyces sp. NPDC058655 TaxID=3346577 RepID=UPI00364E7118